MITIKDFKMLPKVEGVADYLLVRRDGVVVSQSMEDSANLASIIVMSGINCESIEEHVGSKRFRYLIIELVKSPNIIAIALGNFFLGVIVKKNFDNTEAVKNLMHFLNDLPRKRKKSKPTS